MAKKIEIPWGTILTLGGLGGLFYFVFSAKRADAVTAALPGERKAVGQTIAAMLPTILTEAPRNHAEASRQLDDIGTLWRAGKITTGSELNARLTALAGSSAALLAAGMMTAAQYTDISTRIARLKATA